MQLELCHHVTESDFEQRIPIGDVSLSLFLFRYLDSENMECRTSVLVILDCRLDPRDVGGDQYLELQHTWGCYSLTVSDPVGTIGTQSLELT